MPFLFEVLLGEGFPNLQTLGVFLRNSCARVNCQNLLGASNIHFFSKEDGTEKKSSAANWYDLPPTETEVAKAALSAADAEELQVRAPPP